MGATQTAALTQFLAEFRIEDAPSEVVERVRLLFLDGLSCGLSAAQLPWSRLAVEATVSIDGGTGATLWGWDSRSSPLSAALLNGTFIQGFELDDHHATGALHSSAAVVPAALAAAEHLGDVTLGNLLEALIAGYEAGPRAGAALGGGRLSIYGWHSGSVSATVAAAAAAGKLLGLDGDGFQNAVGTAATRAGGLMAAQYGSMVKRMHHGMAAQAGLHGAVLARHGYTGIRDVFDHEYGGLASTFLREDWQRDLTRLTDGLGTDWMLLGTSLKRHACMIGLHSTVDALCAYQAQHGSLAEKVTGITIWVGESVYARTAWQLTWPPTTVGAQMNLRYAAATAIIDNRASITEFSPRAIRREEVWSLMNRIDVKHSTDIDARGKPQRFAVDIEVQTSSGETLYLHGAPPHDVGNIDEISVNKYRLLTSGIMSPDRAATIERLVLQAPPTTPVREIVDALRGQVESPFDHQ